MAHRMEQSKVRVGQQGRVVIPAPLRRAAGIRSGDTLVARLEGGRLILEKRETVLARVRERFRRVPREVSLAEELIRERREEARREEQG